MYGIRKPLVALLLGWKAKKLLYAAVLCWVIGAISLLVGFSTPMQYNVAVSIVGAGAGLMVFGILFLIFAIGVYYFARHNIPTVVYY